MRQWIDKTSQVHQLEAHTVTQGMGTSGGGLNKGGTSPFHSITKAELEEAFGPLSGETPFSIELIFDPVYIVNLGNIAELGKSVHRLVTHNLSVGRSCSQVSLLMVCFKSSMF